MSRRWLGAAAASVTPLISLLAVVAIAPPACHAADCVIGIIDTVAGGSIGDGKPAVEATLKSPYAVAFGPDGSLYIADSGDHRIRKVDVNGVITTIAGDGEGGISAEGGPAIEAGIGSPVALAIGPDGSIYFAEARTDRVLKINPAGLLIPVAGDGWTTFEPGRGRHGRFAGDGGPAITASLDNPGGLAVAADGTLYIADSGNRRVRKVDPNGVITTVAGTGERGHSGDGGPAAEARLARPWGLALDKDGSLFVADWHSARVRRIDPEGIITTAVGTGEGGYAGDGGPASEAKVAAVVGLAVGPDGSLYLADRDLHRVRKVDPRGIITTVAGDGELSELSINVGMYKGDGGPALRASLNHPEGLAVGKDGALYIADTSNHRVRRVDAAGIITTVAGKGDHPYTGDGGPAFAATLGTPQRLAVGPDGSVFIVDETHRSVRWIGPDGVIQTIAGLGEQGYSEDEGLRRRAPQFQPASLAVGPDASLYIADIHSRTILKIDRAGATTTVPADDLDWPKHDSPLASVYDMAVGPDGTTYLADAPRHRVHKVDAKGVISTFAGTGEEGYSGDGGPATKAALDSPQGLAAASDGTVYISDTGNRRIRKVDRNGIITTVAGIGEKGYPRDGGPATEARLAWPRSIDVGGDGSLYIADPDDGRVRKVAPDGIITTVAGCGDRYYLGDGGPSTYAGLNTPEDVAVGADGTVYIADSRNSRVRRVRWLSCGAVKATADRLRARVGSRRDLRNALALYVQVGDWEDAVATAEHLLALSPHDDSAMKLREEVLAARAYAGKGDDAKARALLMLVLSERLLRVHAETMRDAAEALADLYLARGQRDQAISTLEDVAHRALVEGERDLSNYLTERLAAIAAEKARE